MNVYRCENQTTHEVRYALIAMTDGQPRVVCELTGITDDNATELARLLSLQIPPTTV